MNNLDNLRALAIISVFCHHISHIYGVTIPFFGVYGGGVGVQLFFLLSGYLITQSAQKYSLKTYCIHRIFRIFPAYLVIFLSIGTYFGVITKASFTENGVNFLINLLMMQHLSPKALYQFEALHVSWTLTLELLWYILAPLLLFPLKRSVHLTLLFSLVLSTLWTAMAGAKMLDWLYFDSAITADTWRNFYINNAFPGQLCFFVIGAYLYRRQDQLKKLNHWVLLSVFIGVMSGLPGVMHKLTNPTFISGIGLAALFVLALKMPAWHSLFLKWLANISYSVYLLHFCVLDVTKNILHWPNTEGILGVLAITLSAATISYYVIEKPMMNLAKRLGKLATLVKPILLSKGSPP